MQKVKTCFLEDVFGSLLRFRWPKEGGRDWQNHPEMCHFMGRWEEVSHWEGRWNALSAWLRLVVQWSQPLNYSPAQSASGRRRVIVPLISCLNWPSPLKYDSTIWSFIKNLFFSWNCRERFCVFKRKACNILYWRKLRRHKRRKEKEEETNVSHYHSFLSRDPAVAVAAAAHPRAGPAAKTQLNLAFSSVRTQFAVCFYFEGQPRSD